MGMYTELYLSCALKSDIPAEVLEIIKHLFSDDLADTPEELPDHPFFKCDRWSCIGRCSSHYFVPFATSNLHLAAYIGTYYLTTRSDLKNYDGEISKFLDWFMPYIEAHPGDHLGHYRYEEDTEPTLIYYKDSK